MDDSLDVLQHRIPALAFAVSSQRLSGGYSPDAKLLVFYGDGTKALLRLFARRLHQRWQEQARLLDRLRSRGVKAPRPLSLRLLDAERGYCLLSYVDGDAASEVLPRLAEDAQYRVGAQAGAELLKMHRLQPPATVSGVDETAKHVRYRERYRTCGVRLHRQDDIMAFIDANLGALLDRPNRFRHGDYHVANIMVRDRQYAGAVDFESYD